MEKKIARMLNSGFKIYFAALFLFTAVTFYLRAWWFAGAELAVFIILFAFYLRSARSRRNAMAKYVESLTSSAGTVSNDSLVSMPIPVVLLRVNSGEIIWCNECFIALTDCPPHTYGVDISTLIPGFDLHWTAEALGNILDNAVKYSPDSSEIAISACAYDMFVRIDIADQGCGIPEEELTNIWKRFYRGKNAENQNGVGIGLYLTANILNTEGGRVSAKSSSEGSIFSVFLPIS